MSIPPLVCSTPPPPDQCDDDEKNDHFDLNYSLSQEDDYDRNDFDFCSYNSTNLTPMSQNTVPDIESESTIPIPVNTIPTSVNTIGIDEEVNINSNKVEEDNNIEDLDLQLEEESIAIKAATEELSKQENDKEIVSELSPEQSGNDTSESSPSLSSGLGLSFTESNLELDEKSKCGTSDDFIDEDCNSADNEVVTVISSEIVDENNDTFGTQSFSEVFQHVVTEVKLESEDIIRTTVTNESIITEDFHDCNESQNDDDFGEFDDFQFTTPPSNEVISSLVSVNPWATEDSFDTGDDNFGEFHANFDNTETVIEPKEAKQLNEVCNKIETVVDDDGDDDFGDFNDFKSSTLDTPNYDLVTDVPVLNLQTMDNDSYMENVNKILRAVYEEEISEPTERFNKLLESLLCETWGHLLDTDNRQPYMVTWNNSLGQKTLLKALCIDSRNILFGPKWCNTSMPRYAANLGAAPLQPQRQISVPSTTNSESSDKQSKASDTWTDPFTNNGQESCSSDATTGVAPSVTREELEVPNTPKVYPTTLNIQPIRQINLPDTHIYTPTDSETPHSQTIHYDSILVPQDKTTCDSISNEPDNSDYSDFQDFKGSNTNEALASTNTIAPDTGPSNPTISYETQILQPMKVENFPTLNWPDPGHVKETFDDFTDFVSNSTFFNDNATNTQDQDITDDTISRINNYTDSKYLNVGQNEINTVTQATVPTSNGMEDDFDNFQSAIPSQSQSLPPEQIIDKPKPQSDPLNFVLPEVQALSMNSNNCLNYRSLNQLESEIKIPEPSKFPEPMMPIMKTDILKPTPIPSKQPKNMSNQILQPWSLESISQINWPSPGIDLQDLSRFNPVDKVHTLKNDVASSSSKNGSPKHVNSSQLDDDDSWGDFVSSKPKQTFPSSNKQVDEDEWCDFVSSPSIRTNGLNTISLNVHTNLNIQKGQGKLNKDTKQIDIPTLNYINPKGSNYRGNNVRDPHFQNL